MSFTGRVPSNSRRLERRDVCVVFPDLSRPSMTMNAPRRDIVVPIRVDIVGACMRVARYVNNNTVMINYYYLLMPMKRLVAFW